MLELLLLGLEDVVLRPEDLGGELGVVLLVETLVLGQVGARLGVLTEAEAEQVGVAQEVRGLLVLDVLLGVRLHALGRLVVHRDRLVVARELRERALEVLAVRELVDQQLAHTDRLAEQVRGLVALARVVDQGRGLLVLVAVLVVEREELLRALAEAVRVARGAGVAVEDALLPADAGEQAGDGGLELIRFRMGVDLHLLHLGRPLLEVVGRLEVVLGAGVLGGPADREQVQEHLGAPRGVDGAVELDDHLLEQRPRLSELVMVHHDLGAVVDDLRELGVLLVLHVLLVRVVRLEHLLLVFRVLGLRVVGGGVGDGLLVTLHLLLLLLLLEDADALGVGLARLTLAAGLVVLEGVLHREHLRERSVGGELALGVDLEDLDELVVRLAELGEAVRLGLLVADQVTRAGPQELGVVHLDLVGVLVLREGLEEALVGLLRERVGRLVLGLLGLVVPDGRHLLHRVERLVTALALDRLLEVAVLELGPVLAELRRLGPLHRLVVGRQGVDDDAALPLAGGRVVPVELLQLLVDEGRLGVHALSEVTDREQLHHLARHVLVVLRTVADLLEEVPCLGRLAGLRERLDEVAAGVAAQLLGVGLGAGAALEGRGDRLHEEVEAEVVARLAGADRVQVAPRHLVEGVGVDRAVLEGDDLLVQLQRVADLVLTEVVVREAQVGVRDVLAVREVLNEADVRLLHLRLALELAELERVEVQGLVEALELAELRRADQDLVDLDRLLRGLLRLALELRLLGLELAGLGLVVGLLGGVDLLVEGADLVLEVGLLLEEVVREAEQQVRVVGVARVGRLEQALELLDLRVGDLLRDGRALLGELGALHHLDLALGLLLLLLLLLLELGVERVLRAHLAGFARVTDVALLLASGRCGLLGERIAGGGDDHRRETDAAQGAQLGKLPECVVRLHGPLTSVWRRPSGLAA